MYNNHKWYYIGQVLNLTSLWWFDQTKDLVPNHVLGSSHPNITIGKKCSVFPVEFVMRGYITGSTSTRYCLMFATMCI
jgi:phosphoribosylaminoimidazole-succinocarboxamide synthase